MLLLAKNLQVLCSSSQNTPPLSVLMFSRIKVHGVNLYAPSQEDLKSRGMHKIHSVNLMRQKICFANLLPVAWESVQCFGLCSQSKAKLWIVPKAPFIQGLFLETAMESLFQGVGLELRCWEFAFQEGHGVTFLAQRPGPTVNQRS